MNKEEQLKTKIFCIKGCEYLKYEEDLFFCGFYDEDLDVEVSLSENSLRPVRCKGCFEEERDWDDLKMISSIRENVVKIQNFAALVEEELLKLRRK